MPSSQCICEWCPTSSNFIMILGGEARSGQASRQGMEAIYVMGSAAGQPGKRLCSDTSAASSGWVMPYTMFWNSTRWDGGRPLLSDARHDDDADIRRDDVRGAFRATARA